MLTIVHAWRRSLLLLKPLTLVSLFKQSVTVWSRSLILCLTNFWWAFAVDAFIFLLFGDVLAKVLNAPTKALHPSAMAVLLIFIQSIMWFVATSAYELFIRKDDHVEPKTYFKVYFLRYVQILLAFSITVSLGAYALVGMGITKYPSLPWLAAIPFKLLGTWIVFYWLDSPHRFLNIIVACEKAINLFFYNLPLVIVLTALVLGLDYGATQSIAYLLGVKNTGNILLTAHTMLYNPDTMPLQTRCIISLIKYAVFALENWWISIIFVFYRTKRSEHYATSLFEEPCQ